MLIICVWLNLVKHSAWDRGTVGSNPTMQTVALAELAMHWIVVPDYAGSSPVGRL